MKSLNLLKTFNENFSVKAFIRFTILTVIISSSFTAFFILQQSRSLTDNLMKEGELLARLLAYNSRLGVFAENKDLLINSVEGILQRKEVLSVSVFTIEGKLLIKKERPERETQGKSAETDQNKLKYIIEKIKESKSSFHLEGSSDTFEFWATVLSGAKYFTEETLFFDKGSSPVKETIGFVGVVLDKGMLNTQLKVLLFKGILMGIIFLMVSSVVVYLMVKRITRPLNKLTEGVKAIGTGAAVERIPVETKDEIGRLASAFNAMMESLERKEAEKQQLEGRLRQTQKMEAIGILSGGIAHEFNNMLTGIMGYGNLIQMRLDRDNPLRHYIEQILSSAEKAANLTQSLLAFSRKQAISPKPVNLNEIIIGIEQLLVRLVGENIELRIRLADKALIARADIGQMEQVLMNLATNARDAMPDGGVLTIATESVELGKSFFGIQSPEKAGPYALISVMDTGNGMDAKTKERIFDPFFTTKEVGKGTGLGLSMAYGIIKQHGGHLNVYSEHGKGTIFRIYLPLIEPEIEKKESKIVLPPVGGTETVLIAENDEYVREFSKDILERYGYRVIEAIDGEDAILKFIENKRKIQILLLDVIMPKKNGKEAYSEIKKIRPDIKTLFISSCAANVIPREEIIEVGIDSQREGIDFIYKPISSYELLRKVREALDS